MQQFSQKQCGSCLLCNNTFQWHGVPGNRVPSACHGLGPRITKKKEYLKVRCFVIGVVFGSFLERSGPD
jgi:hypothetical protein